MTEEQIDKLCEDIMNALEKELDGSRMYIKNMKNGEHDSIIHNGEGFPNELIFNGDYTILKYDDENIKLKRNKEDKHDPVYAFLYGYFIKNSGFPRRVAADCIEYIRKVGEHNTEEEKIEDIEELLKDKTLDLNTYFEKFKEIMKK